MLNSAVLQGRLIADPELRQTTNGNAVCSFRIAVNRDYAKEQGQQADFIDIVAWRTCAETVSKYFTKGKMILVQGAIQSRSYDDKNGQRRTAVEVVADRVYFCEAKGSTHGAASAAPTAPMPASDADSYGTIGGDDLPF